MRHSSLMASLTPGGMTEMEWPGISGPAVIPASTPVSAELITIAPKFRRLATATQLYLSHYLMPVIDFFIIYCLMFLKNLVKMEFDN